MLYRLEHRVDGEWRLLREITSWGAWDEVRQVNSGSFRLVHPKTGLAEHELHLR